MPRFALVIVSLVCATTATSAQHVTPLHVAPATLSLAAPAGPLASSNTPADQRRGGVRPVWSSASSQTSTAAGKPPFTTADRWVATAAGAFLGFWGGARLGYVATSNQRDDTSGLRGVVIGAPIGAAIGAIVGYRLTR